TKYKQSGQLEELVARARKTRLAQVEAGEIALLGTNIYADANKKIKVKGQGPQRTVSGRVAEGFERLRLRLQEMDRKVVLLPFGALKDYKRLADKVASTMAIGGMTTEGAPSFKD